MSEVSGQSRPAIHKFTSASGNNNIIIELTFLVCNGDMFERGNIESVFPCVCHMARWTARLAYI